MYFKFILPLASEETKKAWDNQSETELISLRTEAFMSSRNMLLSGADAFERIISSYKEVKICKISFINQASEIKQKLSGKFSVLVCRDIAPVYSCLIFFSFQSFNE